MNPILILAAALLPAILLLGYTWRQDPKAEPTAQIAKAVAWGMAICLPVAFLEAGIEALLWGPDGAPATLLGTTTDAFLVAALPEETFKLLALWIVLRRNPYFDEHFDGIVYAVCVGLGFAAVENVGYVFGEEDWMSVALSRALLAVPGHYAFAVLMGYYYSLHHFVDRSPRTAALALLVPVLVHGIYDTLALSSSLSPALTLPFLLALLWFCAKMHKVARARMLALVERDRW